MANIRITAVSYLNTLPFIYGIERYAAPVGAPYGGVSLSLAVPAECARAAVDATTDIALIPVAAIPQIPRQHFHGLITDYCLGAEGVVGTVALLSDSPAQDIDTIYLDSHSRTSAELVKVLARELWKISPRWADGTEMAGMEASGLRPGEAVLAIGDKVFALEKQFRYKYDLAAEWSRLTGGMPFVFAAWVACTPAGAEYAPQLNEALRYGTEHIAEAITGTRNRSRDFEFAPAYEYLTRCIKFDLDAPKRAALQLFWEKTITPG